MAEDAQRLVLVIGWQAQLAALQGAVMGPARPLSWPQTGLLRSRAQCAACEGWHLLQASVQRALWAQASVLRLFRVHGTSGMRKQQERLCSTQSFGRPK